MKATVHASDTGSTHPSTLGPSGWMGCMMGMRSIGGVLLRNAMRVKTTAKRIWRKAGWKMGEKGDKEKGDKEEEGIEIEIETEIEIGIGIEVDVLDIDCIFTVAFDIRYSYDQEEVIRLVDWVERWTLAYFFSCIHIGIRIGITLPFLVHTHGLSHTWSLVPRHTHSLAFDL
ncbi:hypothetical protein NMY22_g7565 [Coprinellus aureogranulatus]|nr:hypothetical protein NMY22_g7565 [Coprinellus aureogranulatus]